MKWVSNHNRVHDNRDGWCRKCHSRFHADDIAERHNADCDAYEARIAELERRLDEIAASGALLSAPDGRGMVMAEMYDMRRILTGARNGKIDPDTDFVLAADYATLESRDSLLTAERDAALKTGRLILAKLPKAQQLFDDVGNVDELGEMMDLLMLVCAEPDEEGQHEHA